jgi:hypothetical protein
MDNKVKYICLFKSTVSIDLNPRLFLHTADFIVNALFVSFQSKDFKSFNPLKLNLV